jgi:hypothetical protein
VGANLDRKIFLEGMACTAHAGLTHPLIAAEEPKPKIKQDAAEGPRHPRTVTMWEFSWIKRRWDGAGYTGRSMSFWRL